MEVGLFFNVMIKYVFLKICFIVILYRKIDEAPELDLIFKCTQSFNQATLTYKEDTHNLSTADCLGNVQD